MTGYRPYIQVIPHIIRPTGRDTELLNSLRSISILHAEHQAREMKLSLAV